ncbi:GNAT family N-acetyltransferase [Blastococcus montanus]|uniref:GNAT family N-acetyltransferase n=1 Tax=Blastococcus montanus TaxID=3144973 RepID=UPI003209A19B
MTGVVREARHDDLSALRDVERAAGHLFARLGMDLVADDEPPSLETLREYADGGRAWVRTDDLDRPVAYLLAAEVDGCAHLEQVSVHPDHAGRRLGQELLSRLEQWARGRHLPAITLTTYTDVPWNGPYYQRLGFRVLTDAELSPGLRRVRRAEADHGLDRWPRAAMRREVRPPAPSG